jgi:hypothetical protein
MASVVGGKIRPLSILAEQNAGSSLLKHQILALEDCVDLPELVLSGLDPSAEFMGSLGQLADECARLELGDAPRVIADGELEGLRSALDRVKEMFEGLGFPLD